MYLQIKFYFFAKTSLIPQNQLNSQAPIFREKPLIYLMEFSATCPVKIYFLWADQPLKKCS